MGWTLTLVRASLQVIGAHRRLVVFPIVSGLSTIVVIVATALPVADLTLGAHGLTPLSWVLIAIGYFVLGLVTVFCNAALVHAANLALRGEEATIATGFRGAARRFGAVALWALISCTVSLLLRTLHTVRLGALVEAVLGLAWQFTTYLVIPLIVVEHDSVPVSLRRSRELLRRTWGPNVRGTVGVAAALVIAAVLGMAILIGAGVLLGTLTHSATTGILTSGIASAVWLLLLAVLGGTISALFRTALYRFATDGTTVGQFRELNLATAFD